MRIAVYNCFAGQNLAETGLSKRICKAAQQLQWECSEVSSSAEVNSLNPDFVLALHFFTPKLTAHPTYGCMWSPPCFYEGNPEFIRNVLSYDGYLSSSEFISEHLRALLRGTRKNCFIAPFFTSCHFVPYQPPKLGDPRLLYAGTNWDGARFQTVFQLLDSMPFMDVYGGAEQWRHINSSYRGSLPFDGVSILRALNQAGAGLCLHKREHQEAGAPSLRIFEIAASGAVGICQEHPFIRSVFGDSVLYLDCDLEPRATVARIADHMRWIRDNPEKALALSRDAFAIFAQHFTFEKLLAGVESHHKKLPATKRTGAMPRNQAPKPGASVQLIVRTDRKFRPQDLIVTLESLMAQTYSHVHTLLLPNPTMQGLIEKIWQSYSPSMSLKRLRLADFNGASRFWKVLDSLDAAYFGTAYPGTRLYPEHIESLVEILEHSPQAGAAYAAAVCRTGHYTQRSLPFLRSSREDSRLEYFTYPLEVSPENAPAEVIPGGFLARCSLLPQSKPASAGFWNRGLLRDEARLVSGILTRAPILFSHQVTVELEEGKPPEPQHRKLRAQVQPARRFRWRERTRMLLRLPSRLISGVRRRRLL